MARVTRHPEPPSPQRPGRPAGCGAHHGGDSHATLERRSRGLAELPDVRPAAQEDRAAVLEEPAAVFLLIGRHAGRADAVANDATYEERCRRDGLGAIEPDVPRSGIDPEAAVTLEDLDEVAHQALVLLALPDEAPAPGRRLEVAGDALQLVEGPGRIAVSGRQPVAPVVEQSQVGPHRDAEEAALVEAGGQRGGQEPGPLPGVEPLVEREQPPRRGELGGPGHVHVDQIERGIAGQERGGVEILAQIGGLRPLDQVHADLRMVPLEGARDGFPERLLAGRKQRGERQPRGAPRRGLAAAARCQGHERENRCQAPAPTSPERDHGILRDTG